jgi:hypothetical protein
VRNKTQANEHEYKNEEPHSPTSQRVGTTTMLPTIEFSDISEHGPTIPTITQDDDTFNPPAHNTRQQQTRRTLTQDVALHISEVHLNAQSIAGRKYPLQFLCDWAVAVLDDKTGNLLEC